MAFQKREDYTPVVWTEILGIPVSEAGSIKVGKSTLFPKDFQELAQSCAKFVELYNSSGYQAVIAKKANAKRDAELLASVKKEVIKNLSLEQMQEIINQMQGKG